MKAWQPFGNTLCLLAPLAALPQESPWPEEQVLHAAALPARRAESLAARALAREALRRLGADAAPIGRQPGGAPRWPAPWTGSLSHGGGMAAALLGPAAHWAALGVDIEPAAALPDDAAAMVLDAFERHEIVRLPGGYARWSRAVFAAKECVHKCVHPRHGTWLEFEEVRIRIDAASARFTVEPLGAAARAACAGLCEGTLLFTGDHVVAALAIGREAA